MERHRPVYRSGMGGRKGKQNKKATHQYQTMGAHGHGCPLPNPGTEPSLLIGCLLHLNMQAGHTALTSNELIIIIIITTINTGVQERIPTMLIHRCR